MYEISSNLSDTEALFSANIRKSRSLLPSAATMRNHHVSIDVIKAYYLYYTNDAIDWVFTDQSPFNKQYFDRLHAEYAITLEELERATQLANPQALYSLQANARYLINALKVSGEDRRSTVSAFFAVPPFHPERMPLWIFHRSQTRRSTIAVQQINPPATRMG